ncbi:DedA family protein [Pseudonocardia pini]|uniref:DedA family protein n=1 Tax=Pseudonocardia pini TaxID=2758030 RepID=UPI0015F0EEC1|nr:DedA family protein [Pseudonocardia pini]
MSALALDWTDPQAIGYPLLVGGVLLGSIVPIVPTGAVVGAAAAVAMTTHHLSLPLVIVAATLAAYVGDLVTYGVARVGGEAAVRFVSRGQTPEQLARARVRFTRHGWQLVVIGRLVPAGRIPALVAAGTLGYPWRRLLPSALLACLLWAVAYSLLGILSGGLFDNPLVATLVAAALVLVVGAVSGGIASLVRRRRTRSGDGGAPEPSPPRGEAKIGPTTPPDPQENRP